MVIPIISFVIPVYNAEKYLSDCVNSIIAQKIDSYEIIMVDDGSTDRSGKICDQFQEQYKNIRVIHQDNRGQGAARNTGILSALGEWICFMDDDDWLEEDFYSEFRRYLNTDADVIICAKTDRYRTSKKDILLNISESEYVIESSEDLKAIQLCTLNYFYQYKLKFGLLPIGTPWGKVIKTDLLKMKNIRFIESFGEDRPCLLQVYHEATKIIVINKPLYNYRIHESSMRKYLKNAAERYSLSLTFMNDYVNKVYRNDKFFLEQLYHFNIAWFSYCTQQDFCHQNNKNKYWRRKQDFLNILSLDMYKTAFQKAKFSCLPFRRRILAILIKYHLFFVMDLMSKFNVLCMRIIGKR